MFEYGPFLVKYDPNDGTYRIIDVNYGNLIGFAYITNGPGAILSLSVDFLDVSEAQFIADFLSDLNLTITT